MSNSIAWGIIGSGQIAKRFAADLGMVQNAKLIGVASRNFDGTQRFADGFGIAAHRSIKELLESGVEVVYVATPHPYHREHALLALNAGKAVLCEKPFALNRQEASEVIQMAKAKSVFLMEAMWTRFNPAIREVLHVVRSGKIGRVRKVEANFGYSSPFDPSSRVYDLSLGGGSLLDVGVYCISFAQMIFRDQPIEIETEAQIGRSGVDESARWQLKYRDGAYATGHSSVVQDTNHEAIIEGTEGVIRIPQFWCAKEYYLNGELRKLNFQGGGFQFEAQNVTDCILRGSLENEIMPLQDTLDVMETMDQIRQRWGLRYPGDKLT
jgi:predicted dehydrogenase